MKARLRLVRRRIAHRLRGESDVFRLASRGLRLGEDVFVADSVYIDPGRPWLIEIGDHATIAPRAMILTHDAATRTRLDCTRIGRVCIGKRAYIGAGAILLPGITIGEESIVAAGSVVVADVPPATVVAGNPAKVITSVDEHASRHAERMTQAYVYPVEGWSHGLGIDRRGREQQREDTAARAAYVEARRRRTDRSPVTQRREPQT